MKKEINDRCPLQSECGRKKCEHKFCERDCSYYQGNARPGAEIPDQVEAMEAEWEARMTDKSVLSDTSAPAALQDAEPVVVHGDAGALVLLPVDRLHPHPDNPRKELGDLTELANSIKTNGVFQNLTVVPDDPTSSYTSFTVIIGHRRLAAAKLAGLTEVPCVVTEMTAKEQIQTMLLENMQRSDLTVYEQAQGFQMMLDLGSTVDEIAEKSGFSKATVRRRVKMMELDQDTLKQVSSERQLSLADFDKLAQVEDIKARNQCLAEIGTSQFAQSVATQLRKQSITKNLPVVKKAIKNAKGKAIKQSETWNGKYESIGEHIQIAEWKEGDPLIPEKVDGKLFYHLDEQYGGLRFYQERKKAPPVRKSAEQIAKEEQIESAWRELDEKAAIAYDLRSQFVEGVTWGKKNAEFILRGALIAGVLEALDYMSTGRIEMGKILGIDTTSYDSNRGVNALVALKELKEKDIPALIYATFSDSPKENLTSGGKYDYPKFKASSKLMGLYDWLALLGYEMSDEEKMLLDGTHELYHRGDPVPQGNKEAAQDE